LIANQVCHRGCPWKQAASSQKTPAASPLGCRLQRSLKSTSGRLRSCCYVQRSLASRSRRFPPSLLFPTRGKQGIEKHQIPGFGAKDGCGGRTREHGNTFGRPYPCKGMKKATRESLRACLPDLSPSCARFLPPLDPALRRCVVFLGVFSPSSCRRRNILLTGAGKPRDGVEQRRVRTWRSSDVGSEQRERVRGRKPRHYRTTCVSREFRNEDGALLTRLRRECRVAHATNTCRNTAGEPIGLWPAVPPPPAPPGTPPNPTCRSVFDFL